MLTGNVGKIEKSVMPNITFRKWDYFSLNGVFSCRKIKY